MASRARPARHIISAIASRTSGLVFQPCGWSSFASRIVRGSSAVAIASRNVPPKIVRELPTFCVMRGISTDPNTSPTPAGAKTKAIIFAGNKSKWVIIGVASSPMTRMSTPAKESWTIASSSLAFLRTKSQPWRISCQTSCSASITCLLSGPRAFRL